MAVLITSGNIIPNILYLVTGTQSVVYNSVTYNTGQKFRGVSGFKTFTYSGTGTQLVEEASEIRSGSLAFAPNQYLDEGIYNETTVIKGGGIVYVQSEADKIVNEKTEIKGFSITYEDGTKVGASGVFVTPVVKRRLPHPWTPDPPAPLENRFTATTNQLWSNPANWASGHVPTASETAVIYGSDIILDVTTTIEYLVVREGYILTADNSSRILTVTNNVTSTGLIDFSGSNATLTLKGLDNRIDYFVPGSSTITYEAASNQNILGLKYYNLTTHTGTTYYNRTVIGNISVLGNANMSAKVLEFGSFDFISYGACVIGNGANLNNTLSRTGVGRTVFEGKPTLTNFTVFNFGSNEIEFRGGWLTSSTPVTLNAGRVYLTKDQTLSGGQPVNTNCPLIISPNTYVTLAATASMKISSINGESASSTYENLGSVTFTSPTYAMSTGAFKRDALTSYIGYEFNGAFVLPFTDYQKLYVAGTGTKSLSGNTIVNGSFSTSSAFDLLSYNLIFNNTVGVSGDNTNPTFKRVSGIGSLIFKGLVTTGNFFRVNLGSSMAEFQAGLSLPASSTAYLTGVALFSLNQSITSGGNAWDFEVTGDVLIGAGATLTLTTGGLKVSGTINGQSATSKLDNRKAISYSGATEIMPLGILDCNQAVNTLTYNRNGAQDIKGGVYRNLVLNTGGVKKLLGNVSVVNTYTLTAPATLNTNGFALTNP